MKRKFSSEFKSDAVNIVQSGVSVKQAAKDLGIGYSTLEKWTKDFRQVHKNEVLEVSERELLGKLKIENQKLKLERELLKKAAVFFATERLS